MSNYIVSGEDLSAVADAIRAKTNVQGGGSQPLVFPDEFVSSIQSIPTGSGYTPLFVDCLLDLQTFTATNFSCSHSDTLEAIANGRDVILRVKFYIGSSIYEFGYGRLAISPGNDQSNPVEWSLLLYGNFGTGAAMFHFQIKLNANESVSVGVQQVTNTVIK